MQVLIYTDNLNILILQSYNCAPKEMPGQHPLLGLIIEDPNPIIFHWLGPFLLKYPLKGLTLGRPDRSLKLLDIL